MALTSSEEISLASGSTYASAYKPPSASAPSVAASTPVTQPTTPSTLTINKQQSIPVVPKALAPAVPQIQAHIPRPAPPRAPIAPWAHLASPISYPTNTESTRDTDMGSDPIQTPPISLHEVNQQTQRYLVSRQEIKDIFTGKCKHCPCNHHVLISL